MKKNIEITIIISVLNGGNTIENCIKSIIEQDFLNWELIVIDGGSIDNTLEILNSYQDYISYMISEKDNGIYDAWNKAILQSSSEWITFIGSDDIMMPQGLTKMMSLVNFPTNNFITSKIILVDNLGNEISVVGEKWNIKNLKNGLSIGHCGSLHHKSLFYNNNFNIQYQIAGDFEFLSRISKHIKATFLNEVTIKMFYGGLSRRSINKVILETCIILWNNNSFSKYYAFKYFINAHLRNIIRNIVFKIPLLNRVYNNFKKSNRIDSYFKHNE